MTSTTISSSPSSLPSPAASTSSKTPFPMSGLAPHNVPSRTPSTTSHLSSNSYMTNNGRDSRDGQAGQGGPGGYMNGVSPEYEQGHYDESTPQPHMAHQPYPPSAYMPQVTTSPPPHAPSYIPPPQFATAPDPIHGMMPGQNLVSPPPMGSMGFPAGPYAGYRPGPSTHGFGYRMPNGHGPLATGPEGYQSRPTQSMGPGSNGQTLLQHSILMNGVGGRPGSAGESRERRQRDRSHQREEDGDRDMREDEVISTIFVVGFPDDMLEREFQNIFTFSPGFEAATLKFPSGSSSRTREPTATLLAELTQIAAAQQAAAQQAAASGEHVDLSLQTPLEEAIAALQLSGTTSTSTTPSAAMSLTPSAQSGPFGQALPQLPTRRQTIGFARFKTRADALSAKEQLQGKKIDPMTGATLKAEMAKKNLHMKRNNPNEELVGMLLRSGRLARLVSPNGQGQAGQPRMAGGPGSTGGTGVTGYPADWEWQEGYPAGYPPMPPTGPTAYSTVPSSAAQPQSMPQAPPGAPASSTDPSSLPNSDDSHPHSITSPTRASDSKALLALAEEADELEGWGAIGGMSMTMEGVGRASDAGSTARRDRERSSSQLQAGSNPLLSPSVSATPITPATSVAPIQPALSSSNNSSATSSLPANLPSAGMYRNNYHPGVGAHAPSLPTNIPNGPGAIGSGPMSPRSVDGFAGSPPSAAGDHLDGGRVGLGAGPNPADQNPPINTLYVGNLPAISPPTHPPNFLEESLRGLFSRCAGYKRMSFRQKINGPMCFVEFEDVPCASQAIKELYGHNLGGLVKGGIRLSYSKNSLGQRGSAHPAGMSTSLFGGIAHTVALAGMSAPPNGSNGSGAYPGTGLQLNAGPGGGGSSGPQSAPIPMPNDLRRVSESSGLSPNAQPFNASLPTTSPRSRYFGLSPSNPKPDYTYAAPPPISIPTGPPSSAHPPPSQAQGSQGRPPMSSNGPSAQPIPQPPQQNSAQFSPVSSPIRTPASYSWVSSGSTSTAGVGNGGYGFEPFAHGSGVGMSLSGAASAWQQGQYGRGQ